MRRPLLVVEDADGAMAIVRDAWTGESFLIEWDSKRRLWTCSGCKAKRGEACAHVAVYTRKLPLSVVRLLSKSLAASSRPAGPCESTGEKVERAERAALRKAEGGARLAAVLAARDAAENRLRVERAKSWTRTENVAGRLKKKSVFGPFGVVDTSAEDVSWRGPRA